MFELDHPVWRTAGATGVAYALAISGLFLVLFVGPYLLFRLA
ncbi:hypothetical protein ACFR97_10835 [Haloplanus litoreus]|uniref:Uncharacterized protein n=1 Tax=Haloplanus litoreus TaxID=767515 RepID=A0ABD6A1H4_9EURY